MTMGRYDRTLRSLGPRVVAVGVFLVSLLLGPAAAVAAPPQVKKPPPPLTALWWQTFPSISSSGNPLDRCDLGTGDVVFLAGTTGGAATRSCTIPAGTSTLIPLINVECSTAEGNGDTPAELRACARGFADQFSDLSLTIDGVAIAELQRFRVHSPVFQFTAAEGNVFGIPAGTTRSVADGFWVLIRPLSPGTHTISFGGAFPPGPFTTFVTYTLTVTS
jgi:hypothetical protein